MPLPVLRAELFKRYGLDREMGAPPAPEETGEAYDTDLSRFFATESRHPEESGQSK
jgi:hypothetical protein